MSQSKVVGAAAAGGATAASLPVTGSPVFAIVAAGLAMVVGGVLLVRAGRFQRSAG
jgi:LPXTG-motif cell wall-anchored protein